MTTRYLRSMAQILLEENVPDPGVLVDQGVEDEDLGLVEDQGRLLSEFKKSCFQYVMNSQDVER